MEQCHCEARDALKTAGSALCLEPQLVWIRANTRAVFGQTEMHTMPKHNIINHTYIHMRYPSPALSASHHSSPS